MLLERDGRDGRAGRPTRSRSRGPARLGGIDADLNAISDTAPTLAAHRRRSPARPVRIRNVAHLRWQESDRLRAVATELRAPRRARRGARRRPQRSWPSPLTPARVHTYDDHRIAMAFALDRAAGAGRRASRDPGCVAKTFPDFFERLEDAAAMTGMKPVVAIDGPAGAGKSTVSRRLAQALGLRYVDTGAMYRVVGVLADERGRRLRRRGGAGGAVRRDSTCASTTRRRRAHVSPTAAICRRAIRTAAAGQLASKVSAVPVVRERLVALQRAMARGGGVVMEGRDIGTVVLPEATVKIFLDRQRRGAGAAALRRARRARGEAADRGAGDARDRGARSARPEPRAFAAAAGGRRGASIDTTSERIEAVVARVARAASQRARNP